MAVNIRGKGDRIELWTKTASNEAVQVGGLTGRGLHTAGHHARAGAVLHATGQCHPATAAGSWSAAAGWIELRQHVSRDCARQTMLLHAPLTRCDACPSVACADHHRAAAQGLPGHARQHEDWIQRVQREALSRQQSQGPLQRLSSYAAGVWQGSGSRHVGVLGMAGGSEAQLGAGMVHGRWGMCTTTS